MGELPAETQQDWRGFAERWLSTLLAVLLRAVYDPALALDLATEALAGAANRWEEPAGPAGGLAAVLGLASELLARAGRIGSVPATERRRRSGACVRLTATQQRELTRLAEHPLELPAEARAAVEALARSAPPPQAVRELRGSGLIAADPLDDDDPQGADHERTPAGSRGEWRPDGS